jgi:maltooligosyltrehalose trehalohydrolase
MKDHPSAGNALARRLPIGAEVVSSGGVSFRVWAPRRRRVEVVAKRGETSWTAALRDDGDGYFSATVAAAAAGDRYGLRLDEGPDVFPDPASRRQPDGPHGLSEVVDPAAYPWRDGDWKGVALAGQVLYEMHVGTFTREGTWRSAAAELPRLAELGITLVEMMPIAEFPGRFGWGYDGVDLFAPSRLYGMPDDCRLFVDEAHRLGLGVILDVVYNHFGPSGNYWGQFSRDYHSVRHHTDWGDAINFDGQDCARVRELFIANAGYWIDEFHFDGLRLDAVHAIVDDSDDHILAALTRQVRKAARGRGTLVFAENEHQDARLLRPCDAGGYGLDAGWNDDFHHVARVAMTGHSEAYFRDYSGSPQELISAIKWGHLYQGQWNERQQRYRGTPALDLSAPQFVLFLQNHDQVGNSPGGRRCHQLTSPGRHRALTALWLLSPGTPLVFQGQEFSADTPFHYFADHEGKLRELVSQGRRRELSIFCWSGDDAADPFHEPSERATFEASKLNHDEREIHREAYALHRDLLRLRRDDRVFAAQRADRMHGSVLSGEALLLRYFGEQDGDRLLLVNLGRDLDYRPATDPLLVPPENSCWQMIWTSEDPRYGGAPSGRFDGKSWYIPGHSTIVLSSAPAERVAD